MSGIGGKIIASGLSAFNETTLALANLNFNFALVKVEPPIEYKELGNCLSKTHRQAAESTEHVFARNLAALFSQIIPHTPHLISAYGKRASEISKVAAKSDPNTQKRGVFQDCSGPDGTSIWAAATSGSGAIAVHLLACMLARAWTSDRAEAIWDEIIQARKHELLNLDAPEHIIPASQFAARIDIDREQISRWNASAKAWLEVADGVKRREQTQLELLIGNTGFSIDGSVGTYRSVIDAWTTAMKALDAIVAGESQSITDGAVILGLKSWHLFPNIFALEAGQDRITLNDNLLPKSAVVTLGISSSSPDSDCGVFWSLPLSFLRYYGDPVPSSSQPQQFTTRLLLPELWQVILGSVYSGWAEYGSDIEKASEFVIKLGQYTTEYRSPNSPRSWLELLVEAAETHLFATGSEKEYSQMLISRGRRLYKDFLADRDEHPSPLFGLTSVQTLLDLITDIDKKVSALRNVAEKLLKARPDALLIRYSRKLAESSERQFDEMFAGSLEPPKGYEWEYATALKTGHNRRKRRRQPHEDLSGHIRWITGQPQSDMAQLDEPGPRFPIDTKGESYQSLDEVKVVPESRNRFKWNATTSITRQDQSPAPDRIFECLIGEPGDAAIFRQSGMEVSGSTATDINLLITALELRWIDRVELVRHLDSLCEKISQARNPGSQPHFTKNLRALAAATDAYKLMPSATVPTAIFSKPLRDALWFPTSGIQLSSKPLDTTEATRREDMRTSSQFYFQLGTVDPRVLLRDPENADQNLPFQENSGAGITELTSYRLTRTQTFACIAMFEDRNVDLDPRALSQVMAISSGNSIYVAMPLLCDPFDSPSGHEVRRIIGNISKPGISLMIPPIMPKILKLDENKWMQINHNPFEGKVEDCFQHTSMHLSFTRYKLPASIVSHGDQAVGANFVETLVSVFDRGEWVADLDILGTMEKQWFLRFDKLPRCPHKTPLRKPRFPLTCIDSWHEFIDRPEGVSVFRARNNWLGRLAGAVLNAQRGYRTAILPDCAEICWTCITSFCEKRIDICLYKYDNEYLVPMFIY